MASRPDQAELSSPYIPLMPAAASRHRRRREPHKEAGTSNAQPGKLDQSHKPINPVANPQGQSRDITDFRYQRRRADMHIPPEESEGHQANVSQRSMRRGGSLEENGLSKMDGPQYPTSSDAVPIGRNAP